MADVGNIVTGALDLLTPDNQTDRLTFRKFDGQTLAKAAETGEPGGVKVTTINLKINPEELSYSEPKITQKIQTASPGRFVVFDWGTDLLTIGIAGNTGNMLPGILTSGFNPLKGFIDNVVGKIDQSAAAAANSKVQLPGKAIGMAQNIMLDAMQYHEIIELSPKYQTFKKLRQLYRTFDADYDVLTLEIGDIIHRGYFVDFSFTQTAMSPWNWKYNITFVSLASLSDFDRRGDASYNSDNITQS